VFDLELKVGQSFKNYKDMCTTLGWEIKNSTNSKNAQYKELARYCKYNKIGHKIIIEEVYETPLPKLDGRGENNNIYGNLIQLLITDLLAQCDGHISISRSKLMNTIGMVNCNYSECRELVQKLAKYTEIDEKIIYDFYNTSTSSFKSVIETSLNSLMDKRVIMYNKIIKVTEKERYAPRMATEKELQLIMKIEKDTLEQMGYKQLSHVRMSRDWKNFKERTNNLLHKSSDINYYFTAYDITIHEEYIVKERNELINLLLEQIKRQETKSELNQLVYAQLLLNAQKRHEKAFTSKKMGKVRMNKSYIDDFERLANLLIDKNTPNILHKIRKIEIDEEIFTPEIIAELDNLFG
jgi:hypothetical protein